jgi:hypothetical protein
MSEATDTTPKLKTFLVIRISDGYVTQRSSCIGVSEIPVIAGHEIVEWNDTLPQGQIRRDISTGQFIPLPQQPSPHHDWEQGGWADKATVEQKWAWVRHVRDALLAKTDWIALSATERGRPVDPDVRQYRQALRDVTLQPDPYSIQWPPIPASARISGAALPTEEI